VAIYPIFISVGLRKNCNQNYIFIIVRLPYDVAEISPGLPYNLVEISPGSHYDLTEISPQLHYDVPKTRRIAIRSYHSCTTMSLRLAGLLNDLATVALRCSQNMESGQDCNTTSRELHNVILCISAA
jgi:hypothetical protein